MFKNKLRLKVFFQKIPGTDEGENAKVNFNSLGDNDGAAY